jgi:hypothetical protein
MPRPAGALPTMIMVTVTVTTLYGGDRYGHHDHDGAPAAGMRQKTRLHLCPGRDHDWPRMAGAPGGADGAVAVVPSGRLFPARCM